MKPLLLFACTLFALPSFGQTASVPDVPGLPPDERVDLTGDGIADVLITSTTKHTFDPQQGPLIWQYRWVQPLPGTEVLFRITRGSAGLYQLRDGEVLSAPALAEGFRYKQLRWSTPADSMRFDVLESNVEQGVNTGWRTGGSQEDGTFVLRSVVGPRTVIADFTITYTVGTSGHVGVVSSQVLPVDAHFGAPDPTEERPPPVDPMAAYFGHEVEPQVIIPPGLPPDEEIDIVGDEAPDVVITARKEHWQPVPGRARDDSPGQASTERIGYYVRGVSPMPGVAFLKRREGNGPWEFFLLPYEAQLTPEELSTGLANGTLYWATPERGEVFFRVLKHPFGMDDLPQEWSDAEEKDDEQDMEGALVYRASYYGREMVIGVLEVSGYVPGGELNVNGQTWVKEGKVLMVR